ncbi:cytochrome c-type biogenesis protein CcmH [Aurantimonas aggregata]|uniref:Cytochrome c-type biogenesis protein n=1 Tax=Aurantimonas aggregata TaxID=2047720 RepID=A0A6L9MJH0_9HYPH|nr:cytochrome c-type biogenesis protein [Aurantimonas aggregata]NDV87796.1 cytochrome c-type biogenesis protein CcmH [Aurantimonas aggregata]
MPRLRRLLAAVALALMLLPGAPMPAAFAVQPDEVLADPALESRARDLSAGLRCLVCQNQSIDDSDAELAKDLRVLVRQRLVAGDTDAEVIDYLVSRYGAFVLLKPRFEWGTLALWGAPVVVLLGGIAFAVFSVRQRRRESATAALSAEEEAALDELVRRPN